MFYSVSTDLKVSYIFYYTTTATARHVWPDNWISQPSQVDALHSKLTIVHFYKGPSYLKKSFWSLLSNHCGEGSFSDLG